MSELFIRLNRVQEKESKLFGIASNISRIQNDLVSVRNGLSPEVIQRLTIRGQFQRINHHLSRLEVDMHKVGNFLGESVNHYIKAEERLALEMKRLSMVGLNHTDSIRPTMMNHNQVYVNKKQSGFLDWVGAGIQSGIDHIGDFFKKTGQVINNACKQAEDLLQDATEFLNSKIETFAAYSTEIYLKARDTWISWKDDVSDFFQENWESLKTWASGVEWGEVGIGTLQLIGGVLETAAGLTIATATSATGIGIAGGLYMSVDGVSNASGGFTRIINGFKGNKDGDTGNFMKAGYKQLSSFLGFKEEYGEVFYNGTQLVIGVISLASGLKDLPKASIDMYKSFIGYTKVSQGAKTFSYFTREGSTLAKFVYTNGGLLVRSTNIYLDKLACGLSLIGVDIFNISTLFNQDQEEKDDDIIINERTILYE
ncbi:DUF4225 domain-containing protein [Vallitalea pronyensis]|uniref:DUF4225 domain-containing protein n=1 Tax=Vallitalea pronyensis TaxID=1348613 RepID=A0A8J8MPV6_9FIRM|nr:DUF4225 domain-containing protein [Vallitalea pronyensis]QUI25203.1 DUF4225 domain-containing protein [Vallitalea pronyensis]